MKNLDVTLENCFGIGRMQHQFDFTTCNTYLIYAPNGTFKTSFAKTLDLISKDDPKNRPRDLVYPSRPSKFEVLSDGEAIQPDNILVVDAEDSAFDATNNISTFLASKGLKVEYDKIYQGLNESKVDFIKKLKSVSQSSDCEMEIIETFSDQSAMSFFDVLLTLSSNLKDGLPKASFRYNDVFDRKGNVKKFLDKHQDLLDQYVSSYGNILSTSKFFKQSDKNSFGTYQANTLINSIEDNSFFEAGHRFLLQDGNEIDNTESLKALVQKELQEIINDEKLKATFDKVDKAIGANVELRSLKKVLEEDNLILIDLKDYEGFKKKVWLGFISELQLDVLELCKNYESQKERLEELIEEAKKESELWRGIIDTFNSRFYVPFKVAIVNQEDVILKEETANLRFDYSDRNDSSVSQSSENLLKVLSKGEQRAYFILQFLFVIESRKINSEETLLVLDDVADSFDYKNKFAVIEYIKERHLDNNFKTIVLTHNFDFYRTVASRLGLDRGKAVLMASSTGEKEIRLNRGEYVNNLFSYLIQGFSQPKIFISLIAFVRNLVEYSESMDCDDYKLLTNCLHVKSNSQNLKVGDIHKVFENRLVKLRGKTVGFAGEKMLDFIFQTADNICSEINLNEVAIQNKICLAIAIRLRAEQFMILALNSPDLSCVEKDQTRYLFDKFVDKFPNEASRQELDKVNLMTPENIHLNAFMFEPIVDMSVHHLVDLYKKVKELSLTQ